MREWLVELEDQTGARAVLVVDFLAKHFKLALDAPENRPADRSKAYINICLWFFFHSYVCVYYFKIPVRC